MQHHVEHSLFSDWVGTDLVRTVASDDDDLVLASLPERTRSGKNVVNRVRRTRAEARRDPVLNALGDPHHFPSCC